MSIRTILNNSFLRHAAHIHIDIDHERLSSTAIHLPQKLGQWIFNRLLKTDHEVPVGRVKFGSFRRVTPISRTWGFERGGPIDRYYIERFLASHANDIHGRVLEISENHYTRRFGGSRITQSDVLDLTWDNRQATMVANLTDGKNIPSNIFDCIILTQTLHAIEDTRTVLETLYRILRPGGVLLATSPGISQVRPSDWGGYWCGGYRSARRAFAQVFSDRYVEAQTYGNVLAAISFLEGLGVKELNQEELDYHDPDFEVTIGVRAIKQSVRQSVAA
jgi:SAM-dependent methyltransferase